MFSFFEAIYIKFEPAHEIMALFVLRKLILQTRMRSHQVGLDVWFLVEHFVYFHTSCMRTAMALAPEPSLVAYVISTIISWAGSNDKQSPMFLYKRLLREDLRAHKAVPYPSHSFLYLLICFMNFI